MTVEARASPAPLVQPGKHLPPPESEYATAPGGFTCKNCEYGDKGGRVCVFPRWSSPGPFDVDPKGCCRWFEVAGMRAVGAPTGFPMPVHPLMMAARGPTGNRVRERKPTERHLERLISIYLAAYLSAARRAAEAAVNVLRETGPVGTRLPEAREAYLRELLPILEHLDAAVRDAARLGASRRWNPRERLTDIERLANIIVANARTKREAWLKKMATDFIQRVVLPALAADDSRATQGTPIRTEGMASAAGAWLAADDIGPGAFTVGDPDKVYEFAPRVLEELLAKGYRFANVRAVEATEYDVWTGDDVAYIEASREDGVQVFQWRTSEDPLVCPVCDSLDGELYSPAEAEQASADRCDHTHCRCRCYFEAVEPTEAF